MDGFKLPPTQMAHGHSCFTFSFALWESWNPPSLGLSGAHCLLPPSGIDPSLAILYPGFSLTMVRIVKVYTCHPQIGSDFEARH